MVNNRMTDSALYYLHFEILICPPFAAFGGKLKYICFRYRDDESIFTPALKGFKLIVHLLSI